MIIAMVTLMGIVFVVVVGVILMLAIAMATRIVSKYSDCKGKNK